MDYVLWSYIPIVVNFEVEDVLYNVFELPLLQAEPVGDAGDVACHRDGGELAGEVYANLPIGGEDGGAASGSGGCHHCYYSIRQ